MSESSLNDQTGKPEPSAEASGRRPLDTFANLAGGGWSEVWFERSAWAFVVLGVVLRVARYLQNYPLWHDEAFVAVNFLDRGYLDLVKGLKYHQVCPLGFLWIELTIVKLLGFHEWSLRLFPTLCAVASVFLFRHVARRVLQGWPMVFAVGVFAVAFYPIRHGAEVKPYASDLLIALALLALAVEWWRAPKRVGWLWALAGFVPLALFGSYPAVFVAGALALGLAPLVWKTGDWRVWRPFLVYGVAMVVTFGVIFAIYTGSAASETLRIHYLKNYWADAFPPLTEPGSLVLWLARMHTGNMLAYPIGEDWGGSGLTFACVVAGAVALWRRGRKTIFGLCLWPFGLGLLAAALGRYPYGGEARIMQYLAPSICLLAGLGGAAWLARLRSEARRRRLAVGVIAFLMLLGVGQFGLSLLVPYHTVDAARAREFARWFWVEQERSAEVVCLMDDLGLGFEELQWQAGVSAVYLCNRAIYSSPRADRDRLSLEPNSERPLRCVVYNVGSYELPFEKPEFREWLDGMTERHEVRRRDLYHVNAGLGIEPWKQECYIVYEFGPHSRRAEVDAIAGAETEAPAQTR